MVRIRKRDLVRVLARAFYIQGAWNFERMLGLGLCFCLIPIAQRICRTKEELISFLQRHLDFFNAQPYMASYALGALTKLEEQAIRQKWNDKRPITIFKERVSGPLGAIGDTLFWQLLKPLSACIGIILTLVIGWVGILIAFIFYNTFHLYVRIMGIYEGYKQGFDIIRKLSIRGSQKYITLIRSILNGMVGVLFVVACYWSSTQQYGLKGLILFVAMVIFSIGLTSRKKLSIELSIIIILSISITVGLMI